VEFAMEKMNQAPILNSIQVAAEVNKAFHSLPGEQMVVIVTRDQLAANYDQPVYNVYAGKGGIVDGKLIES
jgi:hypothetical protein